MNIEDAFTQNVISAMDTNVDGEEEAELRRMIQRVADLNELPEQTREVENIAVLCFVAGRAYQMDQAVGFEIPLSLAKEFMEFLVGRFGNE